MAPERIRLTVRYDGTDFAGSQIQPRQRTVAGTLKTGLEAIIESPVHLLWASRTDAGVHAEGNVCAFDADLRIPIERLPVVLAAHLPPDVEVRLAAAVGAEFHPRYDAVRRTYVYRVYRGSDVPLDRKRYTANVVGPWHSASLAEVRGALAGKMAFDWCSDTTERSGGALRRRTQEQCICELEPIEEQEQGAEVAWVFHADRFLRHMVCRLAGILIAVAQGRVSVQQVESLIRGESSFQFKPAPAKGLTLWSIEYASLPNV